MSFRNKARSRRFADAQKARTAGLKELTRFRKGKPGHDIPRQKPPFQGIHNGKTIPHDGR